MSTLRAAVRWWNKKPYEWRSEWRGRRASRILYISLGFFWLSAACMALGRWAVPPLSEAVVLGVEGFAMGLAIGLALYCMGLRAEDEVGQA